VEELAKGQGEGKLPAVNRPSAAFAIGVLLVILAGILTVKPVWDARSARPAFLIRSLAVLPLENLSGDSQQEYFADGMTDEVITMLAKNKALRVISRTSVMQYKNVHRPLREIAEELGVDGILEGSVGRTGNKVHVTAQLIHAASDTHVWAESYDRAVSDLYTIQSDIAQTIAMQVGVTASVPASPVRRISPEAHDAYLLGRYYWFAFDPEKSRQYFQKAINIQPDYAAAWSGLADAYLEPGVMGRARAEDLIGRGGEAAQRAVTLDDSLAEAHNSMAAVHFFYRWEWERAERESKRTVELNPNFAEGHHLRGYVLLALNRTEEALQEQKKSMELDPFARPWALAGALIRMRQFDAALNEARVRSEAQPENATLHVYLSNAYWHKHMLREAAQEWETSLQLAGDKDSALALHQAFDRAGFNAVLVWRLGDLKRRTAKEYVSPLEFANTHACLNRKDEALRYLEEAYQDHEPWLVHLQYLPNFDFLHSDHGYQAIVSKMGLPAAQ